MFFRCILINIYICALQQKCCNKLIQFVVCCLYFLVTCYSSPSNSSLSPSFNSTHSPTHHLPSLNLSSAAISTCITPILPLQRTLSKSHDAPSKQLMNAEIRKEIQKVKSCTALDQYDWSITPQPSPASSHRSSSSIHLVLCSNCSVSCHPVYHYQHYSFCSGDCYWSAKIRSCCSNWEYQLELDEEEGDIDTMSWKLESQLEKEAIEEEERKSQKNGRTRPILIPKVMDHTYYD